MKKSGNEGAVSTDCPKEDFEVKVMEKEKKTTGKITEKNKEKVPEKGGKEATPVMSQYLELKAQHEDCLLFFRLGDFYELFFQDAEKAAAALNIVLTHRGKYKGKPIPMCGIPHHSSDHYLGKLIRQGFKVAVCEQTETSLEKEKSKEKFGDKGRGGPLKREVVRIITPGTLVEDVLLEGKKNNFLCALCSESGYNGFLGIAFADISTGEFFSEKMVVNQLSAALERIRPSEILVPESLFHDPSLDKVWQEWRSRGTPLPDSRFHPKNGKERLESFFQVKTIESFGDFSQGEVGAAGALTDYILLTQKRNLLQLSRLRKLNHDDFLSMDSFTRKSLELLTDTSGSPQSSLFNAIDLTLTAGGSRLMALRLNHPLQRLDEIHNRLQSVAFFVHHSEKREGVRRVLKSWPDSDRLLTRALSGRNCPKDLGVIKDLLKKLPELSEFFPIKPGGQNFDLLKRGSLYKNDTHHDLSEKSLENAQEDLSSHLSKELYKAVLGLGSYPELVQELCGALADDLPISLKDGGVIRSGYNPRLDQLCQLRAQRDQELRGLQAKYIQETNVQNLKICHNMILGYYVEVPPGSAGKMPLHFQLKQSLVTSVRYTTPELSQLESQINSVQEEALTLESQIFQGLLDHLRQMVEPLRRTARSVAILDVSCALGELAVTRNYCQPHVDCSKNFLVEDGRHPVVELSVSNSKSYTKNSCFLKDGDEFWLLTGPNMAGKSTFLRQNAIIVLMAHMGSFVPARKAHIGLVDHIFSRVGASDDLARGYSTFMVEMVEVATILNQSTERSFVILDELGRGTSTYDGLSLAWSCVEHFVNHLKNRVLFATHYQELTLLEDRFDNISCYTLKVQKWKGQIVFLHEIIPGVSQRSYGLHVAQLAGVPSSVVERAQEVLNKLEGAQLRKNFKETLLKS